MQDLTFYKMVKEESRYAHENIGMIIMSTTHYD